MNLLRNGIDNRTNVLYNRSGIGKAFFAVEGLSPLSTSLAGLSDLEVYVRFRCKSPNVDGHLVFEAGRELSTRLLIAACARNLPPEVLAADLLTRGLEREALRARAETALELLTPREREVVRLTARGYTNHEIAETLVVSLETVKTHVRHALEKFSVHSKAELRLLLLDLGIRWWETLNHN